MANLGKVVGGFLKEVAAGTNIKDYKHATRLFVDDNYRLSPKYSHLFHVFFDFTDNVALNRYERMELGMLVKSVSLPRYSIDTKTLNAYNRPNIVKNKIKYESINISFHDDSADLVRDFWYDYMSMYFRDTDYQEPAYYQAHKYEPSIKQDWGYSVPPERYGRGGEPERILNAIRIYSLHQKRFTEYTLINPTIVSFQHGEHTAGGSDLLTHQMSVQFETVKYLTGYVKPDETVKGFATLHYDKTPSPLTPEGGGTQSILGPGGLLGAATGITKDLKDGNILGAILKGAKASQNFKGQNLGKMAGIELTQIGKDILTGNNPNNRLNIPSLGTLISGGGIGGTFGGRSFDNKLFGSTAGLSTLLGSGGIGGPTGESKIGALASTAKTNVQSFSSKLFNGGGGGGPASRTVQSNGEYIAGHTLSRGTGVPTSPYQTFSDGSSLTTDLETGYQYYTDPTGAVTVTDSTGTTIRQTDSTGRTLYAYDPDTSEVLDLQAGEVPDYFDAQEFDDEYTNMNTYAGYDLPTDQGSDDFFI